MLMAAVLVISACWTACAPKGTPPETQAVMYTGNVLDAATALQKGITTATDAKVLPVPLAQQLTSYSKVIYDKSGPLLETIKLYHVTSDLAKRKLQAADIQKLIGDINGAVTSLLGISIPEGALTELSKLVGGVMKAIGVVQTEVAKGLGVQ